MQGFAIGFADAGDAARGVAREAQGPATRVGDAAGGELQGVAVAVFDLFNAKVFAQVVLGAVQRGEFELAGVEGVRHVHVEQDTACDAQGAVVECFELGA